MGQEIDKDSFTREDKETFCDRLEHQLIELKERLEQPGFSSGPASLGAEAELYIIDSDGCPAPLNTTLLRSMNSSLLTEELNRYNLEINLSPVAAAGTPFSHMQRELDEVMHELTSHARAHDARIASIGILPTLRREHLHRDFMTDRLRYKALSKGLSGLKEGAFSVDINGTDSLKMLSDELTLEGANTSFQVHLKVPADRFADYYNAAQLVTPLVMALSGNSPTFLGKRLWQETRIALFKQSIDDRHPSTNTWRHPARVCFGHGWLREGAWELFAENVALYSPLIPYNFPSHAPFAELRLHHGTVWSWNRAVFDPTRDGHLRIEFRALPSGPTSIDMMANAALITGLTTAFADDMSSMLPALPFNYAEYNFYRAAKDGLAARILWPQAINHGVRESSVRQVIAGQLKNAGGGLARLGVSSKEIDTMMAVIEQRLSSAQTGAAWQLHQIEKRGGRTGKPEALNHMLEDYLVHAESGLPVGEWT